MSIVDRLLRKNTSPGRIAGFVISNFLGLALVLGALQFYLDARSIWNSEDSFISTDYLVINRRVSMGGNEGFSQEEIADLERQPWVRKVGTFTSNDFKVNASVSQMGRGMSTYMFFEAIPDDFIDVAKENWEWSEGNQTVPVIIPKDYLALYNFGFADSQGLPRMSEGFMSGVPLTLTLTSEDGSRREVVNAYICGYTNRLNTILVPAEFLKSANQRLGSGLPKSPSRLIVDVSSPGDVAIQPYLEEHDWEVAGDKTASQASFLLKVVVAIIIVIGIVITLLSFFILLLSVSLLMEKNRDKLHSLLMLGYDLNAVGRPYEIMVTAVSLAAYLLALGGVVAMRWYYSASLVGLGAVQGPLQVTILTGLALTVLIVLFNVISVRHKVRRSWGM